MSYITKDPNYAIATGDKEFDSMQTTGNLNVIIAVLTEIVNNDTTLELQQSVDDSHWSLVPGSLQVIPAANPHHTWNVTGLPKGIYLRVAVRKGSAVAGVVNSIKMLSND
jgi:hypothetical protein